jgi:hypothetical protein
MKIIAFIEGHQQAVLEKILRHAGLWNPPPPRPPPRAPPTVVPPGQPRGRGCIQQRPAPPSAQRYGPVENLDPDFLEHLHREGQAVQMPLPWD